MSENSLYFACGQIFTLTANTQALFASKHLPCRGARKLGLLFKSERSLEKKHAKRLRRLARTKH